MRTCGVELLHFVNFVIRKVRFSFQSEVLKFLDLSCFQETSASDIL